MKKNTAIISFMLVILSVLIAIAGLLIFNLRSKQTTVIASTSVIDEKDIKTEKIVLQEENVITYNENFDELISQTAMIAYINKSIEELNSLEVEDSEQDVVEEEKEEKKEEENKINPYYIKINYAANTVTVYSLDTNGNYTVPVRAMVCSTGKATPTSGVYRTQNKYQWKLLNGNVYGQYSTRITGSILFHSVPYRTNSKNSLISRYYDQLGKKASAGCIRLTVIDAKWIYDNCPLGTQVEIYSSSNPGPLGKPSAKKIASYPNNIKCWDPTDPDTNNPWHTYKEEPEKSKEENKENINKNNTQIEIKPNTQTPTQETKPNISDEEKLEKTEDKDISTDDDVDKENSENVDKTEDESEKKDNSDLEDTKNTEDNKEDNDNTEKEDSKDNISSEANTSN